MRRSGRNVRASVISSRTPAPVVLVVDDYAATREMYFTYLTSKGMRVLVAGEGLTALRLAEREQPDVIVMDLSLPLLDGWEAIWRLKGKSSTAHIPIVACTGNVVGGSGERAIAAGWLRCLRHQAVLARAALRADPHAADAEGPASAAGVIQRC